jgi:hypothetical protein
VTALGAAAGIVTLVLCVARLRASGHAAIEVGTVSERWLAEHRADETPQDV